MESLDVPVDRLKKPPRWPAVGVPLLAPQPLSPLSTTDVFSRPRLAFPVNAVAAARRGLGLPVHELERPCAPQVSPPLFSAFAPKGQSPAPMVGLLRARRFRKPAAGC